MFPAPPPKPQDLCVCLWRAVGLGECAFACLRTRWITTFSRAHAVSFAPPATRAALATPAMLLTSPAYPRQAQSPDHAMRPFPGSGPVQNPASWILVLLFLFHAASRRSSPEHVQRLERLATAAVAHATNLSENHVRDLRSAFHCWRTSVAHALPRVVGESLATTDAKEPMSITPWQAQPAHPGLAESH